MANYCLVHGGCRGGWVWKRVARSLREEGHDVHTPTMTGLGEPSHLLNATINLAPSPFRRFYEKLLEDPAWIIRTIHCGHDAMLDEPEEVVNILREVAEITLNTFDAAQGDKR